MRVFNFWVGGVVWVRSDLESRKKIRVFNFGGVFRVRSDLDSGKNFISRGEGVFWIGSVLDCGKKIKVFQLGGVLGKVRFGIWKEN